LTAKKQATPAQLAARFKKGQTGNAKGRTPIPQDVKEAAKALTVQAIDTLRDVMLNGRNDASRVNAAVAILNRGWGAPTQTLDVDVNHKQDWSALLTALDAHNAVKQLTAEENAPLVIDGAAVETDASL